MQINENKFKVSKLASIHLATEHSTLLITFVRLSKAYVRYLDEKFVDDFGDYKGVVYVREVGAADSE